METSDSERRARSLAETILSAYAQQADEGFHPQQEQTLLARLAEALAPPVATGSRERSVAAANAVLDAWEQAEPAFRGPRIAGLDLETAAVTLAPPG